MAFNAQPASSAEEEVCPTKGTAALCKRDHQAMYEQSYGHDFDRSQLSNLSRTGGNRLWSENPRGQ